MEITEGNVRVDSKPVVTIGDTPLSECKYQVIETEILALCATIKKLRDTLRQTTIKYNEEVQYCNELAERLQEREPVE